MFNAVPWWCLHITVDTNIKATQDFQGKYKQGFVVNQKQHILTSCVLYSPLCLEKHLPARNANPTSINNTTAKIPVKYSKVRLAY